MFTYSEHGEDILIHRLLLWKKCGIYVDVGCYDPLKMSLTARLRMYGWRGINIDIDPSVIDYFNKTLPNDTNINVAIGDPGVVEFYRYKDSVLNTISEQQHNHLQELEKSGKLFTSFVSSQSVKSNTLEAVIESQGFKEPIDFLNIDIEGVEYSALAGYPFGRFDPTVIAVEMHRLNLERLICDPIVVLLKEKGYRIQSYVFHTAIFVKQDFDEEICHRYEFPSI